MEAFSLPIHLRLCHSLSQLPSVLLQTRPNRYHWQQLRPPRLVVFQLKQLATILRPPTLVVLYLHHPAIILHLRPLFIIWVFILQPIMTSLPRRLLTMACMIGRLVLNSRSMNWTPASPFSSSSVKFLKILGNGAAAPLTWEVIMHSLIAPLVVALIAPINKISLQKDLYTLTVLLLSIRDYRLWIQRLLNHILPIICTGEFRRYLLLFYVCECVCSWYLSSDERRDSRTSVPWSSCDRYSVILPAWLYVPCSRTGKSPQQDHARS